MKNVNKLLAMLLCVLMTGQLAVFAAGDGGAAEGTNVAAGKAAFSYNSAEGANPGMAIDGDPGTAWLSEGANGLHDQFIIDLGASFPVGAIGILPAKSNSAQHFTVYGVNSALDAKTALASAAAEISATNQMTILNVTDAGSYRYLIFDQISGQPALGFAEIEVYATDGSQQATALKGAAQLLSPGKTILATNSNETDNSPGVAQGQRDKMIDGDPASFAGAAVKSDVHAIRIMVDLEEASTLSHIAYQLPGNGLYLAEDQCANFKVVAAETLNRQFRLSDFDVLAEVEGTPAFDAQKNTGLLVFEVPEEFRDKEYRYAGLVKLAEDGSADGTNRLCVGTLQVYTRSQEGGGDDGELDLSAVTDIAEGKAALAYGSAAGTAPYMATDGDPATYWRSAGTNGLHDQFVIDLGASYPVSGLGILPADASSARHFTVYGSDDAMRTDKTELFSVATEITSTTEATLFTNKKTGSYRYLIIDQISGQPALGFAEIAVYTPNESASVPAESGGASIMSVGKPSFVSNESNKNDIPNLPIASNGTRAGLTDADPMTSCSLSGTKSAHMFLDLGFAVPLSHVAYQSRVTGTADYMKDYGASFSIVATNNPDFISGDYDVIAEVGVPDFDGLNDSGLLVFPVDEAKQENKYRYIGVVKPKPVVGAINRLLIGTLQAYSRADDIISLLNEQNKNIVMLDEKTMAAESEISYSANALNGAGARSVVGMFGTRGQDGSYSDTKYASAQAAFSGAYNSISLTAATDGAQEGKWEAAVMDGLRLISYISDMASGARPGDWQGSRSLSAESAQLGNTVTVKGKAGGALVGMVILKPGADFESYTDADVMAHRIIPAAAGTSGEWDYEFTYTIPDGAENGEYLFGVFCEGLDKNVAFPIKKLDIDEFIKDFAGVTADNFGELLEDHGNFFGDLAKELAASETMGKSFMLAKDGFTKGLFDSGRTDWSEELTIAAAARAAVLIDKTMNRSASRDEIAPYISAMPLIFTADYDADEFEPLLTEVLSKITVTGAEELAVAYKRAIALSLIVDGSLKEKERALTEYAEELGIQEDTMEDYAAMVIAGKLSDSMDAVKKSYAGGMDSAVAAIVEQLDDSKGSGGRTLGSGGGGGGGNGAKLPSVPVEFVPAQNGQTSAPAEAGFKDIEQHGWAKDAIGLLSSRGILEGRENGVFDPDGLLTREEAVKLLVLSVGAVTDQTHNGYSDCEAGSWYYPYITAAKANDLVTGFSRTEFGVGSYVTRQDLAVMLYRAMQKKGMVHSPDGTEFTDSTMISEYAAEAVSALGGMGVITGFADGSFAPGENATRAQAAVIFGRFLNQADADSAEEVIK